MLSYQHAYHAGNRADVHKHAFLACVLAYMQRKDKPLTVMETHAGRGLYDLGAPEAVKTKEAEAGVTALLERFAPDHPYRQVVETVRKAHGPHAYPGSPLIAATMKRPGDRLHLAELHPQEHAALEKAMPRSNVHIYKEDGFPWAARRCPPTPRRGLMLIDPSYELAHDYTGLPDFLEGLHQLWPVGVIMLWYPILKSGAQEEMAAMLAAATFPGQMQHEVRFDAKATRHGLIGSGLFMINAPYTSDAMAAEVAAIVEQG